MGLRWYSTVINCRDPRALAHWWAETLGWQIIHEADDECVAIPGHLGADGPPSTPWAEMPPGLVFVPVPEDKAGLNRLHLDLACHLDDDRDALIAGLLERGASYADVGQGDDVTWTVLRDPEGNEFCVLSAREF